MRRLAGIAGMLLAAGCGQDALPPAKPAATGAVPATRTRASTPKTTSNSISDVKASTAATAKPMPPVPSAPPQRSEMNASIGSTWTARPIATNGATTRAYSSSAYSASSARKNAHVAAHAPVRQKRGQRRQRHTRQQRRPSSCA